MNVEQQHALKTLKTNSEVSIKASDKGGNVVLMNNIDYEKMCLEILNNRQCYKKIYPATVDRFNGEFYQLVDELAKVSSSRTHRNFIQTQHPRQPTMYALPKVHKNLQDPPRRHIYFR